MVAEAAESNAATQHSPGRRVLTPVVVCGSPCFLPQKKDTQLISPLLTAAAAVAATANSRSPSLSQNGVPTSESEKLTALNHHVLRELKAARPQPPDIESVVCPSPVQQFRKAWWAGVRPTTCERTCRHRSKVCDAIQLCNDCTGYYCKWIADLVGIPVLKASGRVDPLIFHKDPLAKLYWERISKVSCCPTTTTKCLMCIRRYQLFTHFLPGNLLFRSLVHQSVMKLHEEGFAVDMGLIRKVTRRHLERIAESMQLKLPPEYFSSLQAYDIIVRRGPLVDVLANGLSPAALAAASSAAAASPPSRSAGEDAAAAAAADDDDVGESGSRQINDREGHHMPVVLPFTSQALAVSENSFMKDSILIRCSPSLDTSNSAAERAKQTPLDDDMADAAAAACVLVSRDSSMDDTHDAPDGTKESAPGGDDNVAGATKDRNTGGMRRLRSRSQMKRPASRSGTYYEKFDLDPPDFSLLEEDADSSVDTGEGDSEITHFGARKRKRLLLMSSTSSAMKKKTTTSIDNKRFRRSAQESGMRPLTDQATAETANKVDRRINFDELVHQFPSMNSLHDSTDSNMDRKLPTASSLFDSSSPRQQGGGRKPRGHNAARRTRCIKQQQLDETSMKDVRGASSSDSQHTSVGPLLEQHVSSAFLNKLGAATGVCASASTLELQHQLFHSILRTGLRDEAVVDETAHAQQLDEERRMADGGIRGVFWEPAKEAWCVLLPLMSTGSVSSVRRRILSFAVGQWGSFSSAKWNAVYERLKRNPVEVDVIDYSLRQEFSEWVKINLEFQEISRVSKASLPLDTTSTTPNNNIFAELLGAVGREETENRTQQEQQQLQQVQQVSLNVSDLIATAASSCSTDIVDNKTTNSLRQDDVEELCQHYSSMCDNGVGNYNNSDAAALGSVSNDTCSRLVDLLGSLAKALGTTTAVIPGCAAPSQPISVPSADSSKSPTCQFQESSTETTEATAAPPTSTSTTASSPTNEFFPASMMTGIIATLRSGVTH